MDVLARFERSPYEEVRLSLSHWKGQPHLELRVYRKPLLGVEVAGPEGLRLPVAAFARLEGALQTAREALRQRALLPGEEGALPERAGGPRPTPPAGERWGTRQGRAHPRPPLACPVEYTVRGRAKLAQVPERRRGRSVDISRNGMQVLLPEQLSSLNALLIALHLPQAVVSVACEVVWAQLTQGTPRAEGGYRHGLRFTAVRPHDRQSLDRLLEDIGG